MKETEEESALGDQSCSRNGGGAAFTTTHWSVVLTAKGDSAVAAQALENLCRTYWYPLYAFVRRRGCDPHQAEDSTQAFFAHLLEKESLKTVVREKGKFRTFLLTALTNFLNNEWEKGKAQKRGGGNRHISWDEIEAEELYRHEPVDPVSPEKLFERRWAFTLVEQVLMRLRQEYEGAGKLALFEELQPYLTNEAELTFYALAAGKLGMSEGAVRVALHRLRRRFGELLREQIGCTVTGPEQVEEEIRCLFAAISS